ncbi:C69 family dipeptidase [candidate division KSB1 bacterium]|nr:C69 family dipeptidase [candidate division KSB1 bacterium]
MKKHFAYLIATVIVWLAIGHSDVVPCTIITVGKTASTDNSTINCNVSDSRTTRTWIDIVTHRYHNPGSLCEIYSNSKRTVSAFDLSAAQIAGEIPQVSETYKYLNTGYPCMNEYQLTVSETTFGGRDTLRNKNAMFTCEELCRIIMERAKTAREAIRIIDNLTQTYGYNDAGECLAIADKEEVWYLEILGCGHDKIGAIWAAQRVPQGHVSVCANGSRIRQLNLKDSDWCMASKNVFAIAEKMGWWDRTSGQPFEFCYTYAPESRRSMATRRREWRVFDLWAPSLGLDPNASDFPFSVKPDSLVSVRDVMAIIRDTFEGTDFDITKNIIVPDKDGKMVKSPYANPFMHYDMMPLFKINGGWGAYGERCIARYYCNYSIVMQIRDWLPDPIGGLIWHGYDNPATTTHAPLCIGITDVAGSYKISGRTGFNRECAWWAFNRVADLSAQKWGDMRVDVDSARQVVEATVFDSQAALEDRALKLYRKNPDAAGDELTRFAIDYCEMIVREWWKLGDWLWTKYTGKF